jgi:hypothetical protein
MYEIKVIIDDIETRYFEYISCSEALKKYRRLVELAENHTFVCGISTTVELYKNGKMINKVETEY